MRRILFLLLTSLAWGAAGCGGGGSPPGQAEPPPPPPPPGPTPIPPSPAAFLAGPTSPVLVPAFGTPPHALLAAEPADLDDNGVPDLGWLLATTVLGKPSSLIHSRPGVGDGSFTGDYGGTGYNDLGAPYLAAGDVLGVGEEGLAFALPGTTTGMYLGTVGYRIAGTSRTSVGGTQFSPGSPAGLVVGDWNGDGVADLAVLDATGRRVVAALSHGKTGLASPIPTPLPAASGAAPTALTAARFGAGNGPGLDLLVGLGADGFVVLGNTGTATFTAAEVVPLGDGRSFSALVAGDFDADGNADVAGVLQQTGRPQRIGALLGRGDGAFGALVSTDLEAALGAAPLEHLHAGDFNGDGRTDLALVAPVLRRAVVLLSDAAGGSVPSDDADLAAAGDTLGVHDLDGDGDLDLLVGDAGSLSVQALLNDRP